MRVFRVLALLPLLALLGGCDAAIIFPVGDVAIRERNLIYASTGLMLLIIIPVMVATVAFAWHYRAGNTKARYDAGWHHSTQLEVLIWTAPLLIVIALGALTWISTHVLDPFRAIGRIDAGKAISREVEPLRIDVVALDWKWLFFYPDQGIAVVNELAAPIDVPINFRITSATVMTSFFIPALAGQIYAMAGMETQLHAVSNKLGNADGFAAQYNGAGFSNMNFRFHTMNADTFNSWVDRMKASGNVLDRKAYLELARPSEQEPIHLYASYEPGLYDRILNLCVQPGKMCQSEMMAIDAKGGAGKDSEANYERLKYDGALTQEGNEAPGATFPASGRPPNSFKMEPQGMKPRKAAPEVNDKGAEGDMNDMPGMGQMPGTGTTAPTQIDKNHGTGQ